MPMSTQLHQRDIFRFWLPLASTWLMMAFEGPFLAALIARLPDPRYNLAAYGVAFAVAIIIEAPVIMMLGASTALVDGKISFLRLRCFTQTLNALTTLGMVILIATPAFEPVFRGLIGLEEQVADLTRVALLILLPWPAAIGYRRFHQGLLIRSGSTRLVAYGTAVRLTSMAATALMLFFTSNLPGAWIAASALSMGVLAEAISARFLANTEVRHLTSDQAPTGTPLTYRDIWSFYVPLAWTSVVGLAAHPMVTFFMGHAARSLDSLAVLPVINSLTFIFRALGLAYQEVVITMLARSEFNRGPVLRFATTLGLASSAGLALIVATPLSKVWFQTLSGLDEGLYRFALVPARMLIPFPAISVLLSLQRGLLMHSRNTRPITWATIAEIVGITAILTVLVVHWQVVGAVAAAAAFLGGRLMGNLVLLPSFRQNSGRDSQAGRPGVSLSKTE
jgi:hypothetical protein